MVQQAKKILILGASPYQVPLISAARERGLRTYVASIAGNYRGVAMADVFLEVDIRERARQATRGDEIMIEGFLEGWEFGAQVLIADGKLCYVIPQTDQVSPPPYCSPIGHSIRFYHNPTGFQQSLVDG